MTAAPEISALTVDYDEHVDEITDWVIGMMRSRNKFRYSATFKYLCDRLRAQTDAEKEALRLAMLRAHANGLVKIFQDEDQNLVRYQLI